jgi:hypothetical protein
MWQYFERACCRPALQAADHKNGKWAEDTILPLKRLIVDIIST